jgi:hypothetical protein
MAPFAPLQHSPKRIKKLGAKLAEFVVKLGKHPKRFTLKDVSDAQFLLNYLTPYTVEVLAPIPSGNLSELQLYLDCKVIRNLTKLLEGLLCVCIPTRLDNVCKKGLDVYCSAFAALTRIAEQARAQAAQPQGEAVALEILDQLQPEDHEQAPGMPYSLHTTRQS